MKMRFDDRQNLLVYLLFENKFKYYDRECPQTGIWLGAHAMSIVHDQLKDFRGQFMFIEFLEN
jgi:hypothetical protein